MKSANQYGNIDWERIRKVLVVREGQLRRIAERVVDETTPDELASEVIREFFNHRNRLGWDPKKGALEWFLVRLLDRKWIDCPGREATPGASSNKRHAASEPGQKAENRLEELDPHELLKRVRDLAANDSELVEIIDAVELLDGDSHQANQQVSELIGTSVKDVEKRKKRLRRTLSELRV